MARYRCYLAARSSLQAGGLRRFQTSEGTVVVTDAWETSQPTQHAGLFFTVTLNADDLHIGAALSKNAVARVSDWLAAAHSCAIEDATLQMSVDLTEEIIDRPFLAPILESVQTARFRRSFQPNEFREFFKAVDSVSQIDTSHSWRLRRALDLFRHALLEQDPIDRFEDLWSALETLNVLLQRHFEIETKTIPLCSTCGIGLHSCSYCEAIVLKDADKSSGIRHILTSIGLPGTTYRDLKRKRNDIAHSLKPLAEVMNGLNEATAVAYTAFLHGLGAILDLPSGTMTALPQSTIPLFGPTSCYVLGVFKGLSVEEVKSWNDVPPRLKLVFAQTAIRAPDTPGGSEQVLALQLFVDMPEYADDWLITEAGAAIPSLAEDESPYPQVIAIRHRGDLTDHDN